MRLHFDGASSKKPLYKVHMTVAMQCTRDHREMQMLELQMSLMSGSINGTATRMHQSGAPTLVDWYAGRDKACHLQN